MIDETISLFSNVTFSKLVIYINAYLINQYRVTYEAGTHRGNLRKFEANS